jgi:hypothetical protein
MQIAAGGGLVVNHKELKNFVRDVLGCGCPDEILENINVKKGISGGSARFEDVLIDVGGRLLVLVFYMEDIRGAMENLEDMLHQGKKARDQDGYNRLRIVISTHRVSAVKENLLPVFERFRGSDEKLHLHILNECDIPTALRPKNVGCVHPER